MSRKELFDLRYPSPLDAQSILKVAPAVFSAIGLILAKAPCQKKLGCAGLTGRRLIKAVRAIAVLAGDSCEFGLRQALVDAIWDSCEANPLLSVVGIAEDKTIAMLGPAQDDAIRDAWEARMGFAEMKLVTLVQHALRVAPQRAACEGVVKALPEGAQPIVAWTLYQIILDEYRATPTSIDGVHTLILTVDGEQVVVL